MSDDQEQVAAWIAVGVLVVAVAATLWLAATSGDDAYLDMSDPDNARLTVAWTIAAYFIKMGKAMNLTFAAVLTVISVGVTLVAKIYTRKRDILILSLICFIGIATCAFILVRTDNSTMAERLGYYGDFTGKDAAQVASMAKTFFGSLIAWFGSFLAAVLGISLAKAGGALRGSGGGNPVPPSPPDGGGG